MASSSSTISVFDALCFRTAHNEQLFDSYARRRKVILEVGFNLEDDEYPEIMEQITLRGWRRLAAPRTDISKLLVQEELPYKSFIRGKEIDFSPNNIRRGDEIQEGDSSSSQPPVLIQLRRTELQSLARVHNSLTSANGKQVENYNIKGHPNPHHHARGRCESGGNHN
ncbi:hypothetical protein PIB30_079055 [Stylosanthes scabra]|uniref:Uncharacterized protein n=1 Tax=Stylosanthes scabra TaxID=79078 RepID=A0ABU6VRD6_9FABA|nr:hypothetical protein [Stylosanthes scabra]